MSASLKGLKKVCGENTNTEISNTDMEHGSSYELLNGSDWLYFPSMSSLVGAQLFSVFTTSFFLIYYEFILQK